MYRVLVEVTGCGVNSENYVNQRGDTMLGDLKMENSAKIRGLTMPYEDDEPATKEYVDIQMKKQMHRIVDIDFDQLRIDNLDENAKYQIEADGRIQGQSSYEDPTLPYYFYIIRIYKCQGGGVSRAHISGGIYTRHGKLCFTFNKYLVGKFRVLGLLVRKDTTITQVRKY